MRPRLTRLLVPLASVAIACACAVDEARSVASLSDVVLDAQWMDVSESGESAGVAVHTPCGCTAHVHYLVQARQLEVRWCSDTGSTLSQSIPLAYHPTAFTTLTPQEWIVAGKTLGGSTIIERWDVGEPRPIAGAAAPHDLADAEVLHVERLFEATKIGFDVVQDLFPMRHDQRRLFTRFWDSGDVYQFDVDTRAMRLSASSRADRGVPSAAWLKQHELRALWSADHLGKGFVYVLAEEGGDGTTYVLEDSNRDGVIDACNSYSITEWAADFAEPRNYLESQAR